MSDRLSIIQSDKFLKNYISTPYINHLTVTKAGYFPCILNHSILREKGVDEYILIYCISGKGCLGGSTPLQPIKKGDVILIKPHTPHTYSTSSTEPWSILWVHFTGSQCDFLMNQFLSDSPYFIIPIGYQPQLVDVFHSLLHTFSVGTDEFMMLRTTTYLQYLLCEIISLEKLSYKQQKHFKDIRKTIYFMKNNLSKKLSLDELANMVNLSKYHFSRKFKDYTDHSPLEYFNNLKIQYASELLQTTDFTIKEISEQLGFSTPYYFSECFKQLTGYSPSQYKHLARTKF